jgi:THO complex subunit 5
MKLEWPPLNCESVPWVLHTPLCNLHGWSPAGPPPNQASTLAVTDTNIVQEPIDVNMDGRLESAREDGELPSLIAAASAVNDVKLPPKVSTLEHSRQLSLMSKSIISPISKVKSQSFKKHDEDFDLLLDTDSDLDELSQIEPEVETDASIKYHEMAEKSWVDYGVKEYTLVLIRKKDDGEKKVKLEAKVSLNYSLVLVLH